MDIRVGNYYWTCNHGKDGNKKLEIIEVTVNPNGWARGIEIPGLVFPIYKSCCKFYKDKELNQEVDMSDFVPTINLNC